jgi:hypothetical protein
MLLSHRKQFIYFKTRKTASTSVEIFFEPFCVEDPAHVPQRSTTPIISPAGIVGARRDGQSEEAAFYASMPAIQLLQRIGLSTFNRYFKFANVRNPFDKMVSRFWWVLSERGRSDACKTLSLDEARVKFRRYIAESPAGRLDNDRPAFFIGPEPVADAFIRYEHLAEDMAAICARLGIEEGHASMGRYNSGARHLEAPFADYYDEASVDKISRIFSWDIKKFGYQLK